MSRSLFDAENFPSFNKPWIRMLMGELYSPRETHFVWAVCDVHDCEEYDFLYTRWGFFLITRIPPNVKRLGSVPVVMGFLQLHPHLLYHSGWWLFFSCVLHVFCYILLYYTAIYIIFYKPTIVLYLTCYYCYWWIYVVLSCEWYLIQVWQMTNVTTWRVNEVILR